jgi:mannosyltransferase
MTLNRLVLDCIIFGLQRFGGISNFWMRLMEATTQNASLGRVELLMPRSTHTQEMPDISGKMIYTEFLSQRLSRYLPAQIAPGGAVFHTSYYRLPRRSVDRYITSVYDFTYERYFNGLPKLVHHVQKRASVQAADMSVCISEATRTDLLSYFSKVDPAKTCVVPLGVDCSRFYPDHSAHDGGPYVLFVGQRAGYKRFDLAVDALSLTPDLALAIVGQPLTADEKARLEELLPGRWVKHESVGGDALRRLYSNAFAFLFPSDYEGFGLPILEAMACNCPTVAANRSSFPEVAGDAALLAEDQTAEVYAALLSRLEDDACRARLVAAGKERVTLFEWQRTFSRLWDCYR